MRPIAVLACSLLVGLVPASVGVCKTAETAPAVVGIAAPSPAALQSGLAGRWTGALGYRDYQTDELFEIPVSTTVVQVADGVTQVRISLFDDGPARPVWITTTSLQNEAAGTVSSASYRSGRPVELGVETVRLTDWSDDTHWTLVYDSTAEDDDQPAEIRVTETRDGDSLMSVKAVRPVGGDETAWRFRNQTRLTRVGD
jgi:hypothetical protein